MVATSETWAGQGGHGVRFEWGPAGARQLGSSVACLVVVDVLSFTTSVDVAVAAGAQVLPYPWRDDSAAAYAKEQGAALAVGRRAVSAAHPWSLSPASLRGAELPPRLVLPSPNGSTIAAAAPDGVAVVAACLRNASAVGSWLTGAGYGTSARPVGVIASGEQWPDGALRPAIEDLLGAGAVIAALGAPGELSPEAAGARAVFDGTQDVEAAVRAGASGRELVAYGFPQDVDVAVERDVSRTVPLLSAGAFTAAS
ncbi:2-phosphosulfolactate phosphatase [Streptomyces sp. TRM66268-LWL]|uniref:Probable 2-phosphosulfolactate phosphatase n=1 Tax=Streptomyces polyasparticus TaxID=2767826 RepID=A0ABR7S8R8_9ACTN|nr:2-phosphosulfolactate phosphatase [Streptomyces polyasparticus]MBC9711871.1 2-phosphosulfolactate phosphatase [Streptomyces polyasparticus]